MEPESQPQLTQRQLQLIQYATRCYSQIQRRPILFVLQSLLILQLIGPVLVNAGGPELLWSISFFYALTMVLYTVTLGSTGSDSVGKYFQRHYGEVTLAKSKYSDTFKAWVILIVGLVVAAAFFYASTSHSLNAPAIFATLYTLIDFLVWLRKPDRQIQFYYPLIRLPIALFFWLPLFSPQFDNAYTSKYQLFILMIAMGFISLTLFLPIAFDALLLNKVFQGVPQNQPKSIVLQPNGDIPPMILQTLLAVLAICENVDNRYLQRLTGLDRANITQILVQLRKAGLVYIGEQEIEAGSTRLIVSLTITNTEAASMVTSPFR